VVFYPFPTRLNPEADVEARISGGNSEEPNTLTRLGRSGFASLLQRSSRGTKYLGRSDLKSRYQTPSRYLGSSCTTNWVAPLVDRYCRRELNSCAEIESQ
jgi:hypothetical protein